MSLRGPAGPTTQRGKQKSRQNATKHGIFAVGIVRKRESKTEYLRIVEDMVETLQPVGRLEEILVEKLAMLVWRYRRLLQAEAAEVARQAEPDEEGKVEGKTQAAVTLKARRTVPQTRVTGERFLRDLTRIRALSPLPVPGRGWMASVA